MIAIHYDCDPGQDDVIAIMYVLGSGKVDVQSLSIVGGNADVKQCARNAQQILDITGFSHIPVYVGAARPLARPLVSLPEVFGESGMDGAGYLPDPSTPPEEENAVDFMLKGTTPKVWVATGPLTNMALALQKNPQLAQHIEKLIVMGGCVYPEPIHGQLGNYKVPGTEGFAEYNFAVDPEAARIVFESGIKDITLIGVDITRTVLFNHKIEKALRENKKACAVLAADILSTVGPEDHQDYADCKDFPEDPVRGMHDVVAIAYLTDPELFQSEMLPLRIITEGPPYVAGQLLIDEERPDHPAVRVVTDMDRTKFLEKLIRNLNTLP
ncbi:MAG: hypothetical protein COY40_00025 [Alphaproteobacteria bacterium CG_4_10_14_0_8_um_filter_53_9]|nr:MAG: hypothetical protein COY40_00025 [Alphaproteobacteria bacterium CG_4_10_14_0_8_um_filter_53_9]